MNNATPPPETPDPTPQTDRLTGGVSTAIGYALASAISVVSIAVCFDMDPPLLSQTAASAALTEAGKGPVWLTNPRGEEIVWASEGRIAALPPWKNAPDAANYIALAHDPSGLPSAEPSGPLAVSSPWVARRYGRDSAGALDLMSKLDTARVQIIKGDTSRTCDAWRFGRWFCGPKPWHYVGPETLTIDGKATQCLWLHPLEKSELRVTIPDLPAGGTLTGRVALSDEAAGTRGGSPVRFRIEVDGEVVTERTHPNKQGWSTFKTQLGEAGSGTIPVTFVASAARTGKRHFCLQASVEGSP